MSCLWSSISLIVCYCFFFFHDTATSEIYTLSLHDALPILLRVAHADAAAVMDRHPGGAARGVEEGIEQRPVGHRERRDRKSTRLNSSHVAISYAVFCLKKKKSSNTKRKTTIFHTTLITL